MKGLLRNNICATRSAATVFSAFLIPFGIFAAAVISQSLQIGYVMTATIGFSFNAASIVKNESASKWNRLKLTLPVRRADVIRSLFVNQLIWLSAGLLFSGAELGVSWLLHGCMFDQPLDILSLFALGISMSLFMGAVFFPLCYAGGEERSEAFLIISVLCAFVLDFTIISMANDLLEPGTRAIVAGAVLLIACSLLAFALSYPLTVWIYQRKDY